MARKRLLSPEFFMHGELYDAEAASKLPLRMAFAGLWTACDRRGLFVWKPRELKLAILPYDPVDFAAVLDALEQAGFVARYEVDGKLFGRIPSFGRWQTFHKHEKPSDVPEPPEGGGEPSKDCRDTETDGQVDAPGTAIAGTVAVAVTSTGTVASTGAEDVAPRPRPVLIGESAFGAKLPTDNDRAALTVLMHAVPNRLAWLAELEAGLVGMHGAPLTVEQMAESIRDYVAAGHHADKPSLSHFRHFMRRAAKPPPMTPLSQISELERWAAETDAKEKAAKHA